MFWQCCYNLEFLEGERAGIQLHFHINTNICAACIYLLILKKL